MNVSCYNANIVNIERPLQGILDLKKAGFDSLTAEIGVWFPDFYGRGKESGRKSGKEKVRKRDIKSVSERYSLLFTSCREHGIHMPLVQGPSFELMDPLKDAAAGENFLGKEGAVDRAALVEAEAALIEFGVKAAMECIEFCGRNGVERILIRPVSGDGAYGREWEVNHEFYRRLLPKAKEWGVEILLQNRYRNLGGHLVRGVCAEASQAAEWLDRLNAEAGGDVFGFCVDSGICSICGNDMHEFITMLGNRVKAVILRDCDGKSDTAMLPFTCVGGGGVRTDWTGLIRGLRDIEFDGELIVNFSGNAAAFSPLLHPAVYGLAKEVGDFFRWQTGIERTLKKYRSIALFGAGNMCRNYMKCYGEKYPPLFACDNNPKLWDTEFEGLTVKNPEELKKLPKDCGVYICNMYYREIEAQLREMGIENIEYFNDEYMPSFYFDRLEREEE